MRTKKIFLILVGLIGCLGSEVFGFEMMGWPGEGIPVFSANSSQLTLYPEPSKETKPIFMKFQKDKIISFDRSKVITKQSTFLNVKKKVTDVWCGDKQIELNPGDTIEYLQYRAEGYGIVVYKGDLCEVSLSEDDFEGLDKSPVTEWWIRVIDTQKKPLGWLLVDQFQVKLVDRKF